ncbi:hypothetical protein [Aureibacter tunicatorum]|uniref:Uncharacterized protein n=1 Tax=Aureibacter tunicatorum TaxID=866807 RepID=A0AAE3XQL5_9BACT|nr:hypothetical protein [Aureibacter tunicatorum]MDR6240948.1 hypothetical protein [Aureibacter tunicatorum]BDD03728.1 hypothetical protein AUTU_12110 [Aureibacter tunicatorum]
MKLVFKEFNYQQASLELLSVLKDKVRALDFLDYVAKFFTKKQDIISLVISDESNEEVIKCDTSFTKDETIEVLKSIVSEYENQKNKSHVKDQQPRT